MTLIPKINEVQNEFSGSTAASTAALVSNAPGFYIANFGMANYLWPTCLEKSTIATFELASSHRFSVANDKEGFILHSMANVKTARGISPNRQVASRWFNVGKIVETTANEVWLHRAGDDIWWTISAPGAAAVSLHSPEPGSVVGEDIYQTHKPAMAWSNKNLAGHQLSWRSLHRKARTFMTTEATLQKMSPDNAEYAAALILGRSLLPWHNLDSWNIAPSDPNQSAVSSSTAWANAAMRMAMTAWDTTKSSNGQQTMRTVKNKNFGFLSKIELEAYLLKLRSDQEGFCAISGMVLQYDGQHDDAAMLCSLDRIDSDGHYEAGNLQIVCRFINEWKSDEKDAEFRRLLGLLRSAGDLA